MNPCLKIAGTLDPRMLYGFLMLYQVKNYRIAAEQLSQSIPSLSRYIKALETQLGIKLFQRTTRQVIPTQAAHKLYEQLQKPLQDLSDVLLDVQQTSDQIKGLVRLTTTSMLSELVLPNIVRHIAVQYPEINLELILDENITDLRANSVDIAIRAGSVQDESLVGQKLTQHLFYEYCAPEWLKHKNVPRLAYFDERLPETAILNTRNMRLTYLSARAGAGRAILPELLCNEDEQAGRLVKYRPDILGDYAIYLLYPSREHIPQRVKAILQLIRREYSLPDI